MNQSHDMEDHFIEKMGFLSTLFNFPKLVGQIYGVLYLSPEPLCLNDLMKKLHVSKGSISTNIRELEKWGGCKKVWIKGNRRDFYEAETDFKAIFNKRLKDALKRRIETIKEFDTCSDSPIKEDTLSENEKQKIKFIKKRLGRISEIQKKLNFMFHAAIKLI